MELAKIQDLIAEWRRKAGVMNAAFTHRPNDPVTVGMNICRESMRDQLNYCADDLEKLVAATEQQP